MSQWCHQHALVPQVIKQHSLALGGDLIQAQRCGAASAGGVTVARAEARRLKLRQCGTLGILVRAHRRGLIPLDQTELLIREIAARPDIWIAARLCDQALASLHLPTP